MKHLVDIAFLAGKFDGADGARWRAISHSRARFIVETRKPRLRSSGSNATISVVLPLLFRPTTPKTLGLVTIFVVQVLCSRADSLAGADVSQRRFDLPQRPLGRE